MKKTNIFLIIIAAMAFLVSMYFYPLLPDKIASHWDINGNVNGYMPKLTGVFFVPVLVVIMSVVFSIIPKIDPYSKNIEHFRKYYDRFIIMIVAFMAFIQLYVILWNLGNKISINFILPFGIGTLFFYVGELCVHSKRNWFIGIRTPWTLSSDKVWDKTNKLGGKLFKAIGIIALFGALFQRFAFHLIFFPAIIAAVSLVIYSYLEFRKGTK